MTKENPVPFVVNIYYVALLALKIFHSIGLRKAHLNFNGS